VNEGKEASSKLEHSEGRTKKKQGGSTEPTPKKKRSGGKKQVYLGCKATVVGGCGEGRRGTRPYKGPVMPKVVSPDGEKTRGGGG